MKQNKKNASVSELVKWLFKQSEFLSFIYKTKRGKKKSLSEPQAHRIFFGGGQKTGVVILAAVSRKHDQTHHTAEGQSQLQRGEHHVARPAHSGGWRLSFRISFPPHLVRMPLKMSIIYTGKTRLRRVFGVPDCLLLRACAEVSLDLSLVHPVQGEHEEDAADGQSPEGVSLCGIWVQAEMKVGE